jgi:hypothetical protein
MKTDDVSEEADEPPEEPPRDEGIAKKSEHEENEELEWARRNVPEDGSGPRLVFRKTELHDKPPGSRSYRAAVAPATGCRDQVAKELAVQIAALNDRIDTVEDRIDRAIDRLDRLVLMLKHPGES